MLPPITFPIPLLRPAISSSDVMLPENVPSTAPSPIHLPSFSHIPAPHIRGQARWPHSLDAQSFPSRNNPGLEDILLWVHRFLEPNDRAVTRCIAKSFIRGPTFGPLWFTRPWSPNRRRRWGFGALSRDRTVVNDKPPKHLILHFVWQFLTPQDRQAASQTCPQWYLYHQLRWRALLLPIATLKHLRSPPGSPEKLPMNRALLHASALLRFHFNYGDFLRWLGGEYTNRGRDWDDTFDKLTDSRKRHPPKGFPPADFPRGKRGCTEGVPLKGHFESPVDDIEARDRYDNHPAVNKNKEAVEKKFAKEEEKSFHIHLPRFLCYFIVGLMINPIQWAW